MASTASAWTTRTSTSASPSPASTSTSVIPFIDPRDETMLEYHLSKAIAEVSTPTKPKIGIMSALDLKGGPGHDARPARRPRRWVIYQQLKQSFDLVDIPMEAPVIDPEGNQGPAALPSRGHHPGSRVCRRPIPAQRRHRRRLPRRLLGGRPNDRRRQSDDGPAGRAHHLHPAHPALRLGRFLRIHQGARRSHARHQTRRRPTRTRRADPHQGLDAASRTTSSPRI